MSSVEIDNRELKKQKVDNLLPFEIEKYKDNFTYQTGYGNELSSEAKPDALPKLGFTPLKCAYGLYAEQLSGTSFTTPRVHNRRTWLYKIRPSAAHRPLELYNNARFFTSDFSVIQPNQLRWKPFTINESSVNKIDFIDGIISICGAGDPSTKTGCAVHVYCCNTSMNERVFCNSDADMLIVPQQVSLIAFTEMGKLRIAPGEFCVIPRGIKFRIDLDIDNNNNNNNILARGYICEVYDNHFVIPDLGPIGSNGLANTRHFCAPTACYEDELIHPVSNKKYKLIQKFLNKLYHVELDASPLDIVAWTGNYLPYKYDMGKFNTINSVSYDHLDPSIFTVLTAQTTSPGVAALDFVVFPPRYAVQEDTFRPPYYHRNCMSEFMGNIMGQYDAKPEGFVPGSASLHSCMIAHGPDSDTYKKFSNEDTAPKGPVKMSKNDLAFMFESTYIFKLTPWAANPDVIQTEYYKCWLGLTRDFSSNN